MNILIANEYRLLGEGMEMIVKSSFGGAKTVVVDCTDNLLKHLSIEVGPRWDIIFIDGKLSELVSTKQLHKLSPRAKICLFNSCKRAKTNTQSLRDGFHGLLPTSSTPSQVKHAIHLLLSGQKFFPEQTNLHVKEPLKEATKISGSQLITFREQEILSLTALGMSNKKIANHCDLTESTVKRHLSNVFKKLGAKNRVEASRIASERKLLSA